MAEGSGDGLPFIGSLMRLISSGDIAYQGTLFTIDMPNSTIALSNVRCFGTEGRRKDNEVPPSDQVFEYVVFKGAEIKELTVVQPPPPQAPPPPPPAAFQDPAIVSAGPPPPGAGPWGGPPPPPQQPYGAPPPFGSSPWGPQPPGAPGGPPPPPPHAPVAAAPPPPRGHTAPAPAPTVSLTPVAPAPNGGAPPPLQQQRPPSYAAAAGGRAPLTHPRGGGRGRGRGQPEQRDGAQGGRGGGQQGGRQPQAPRPPPVEVPKEEFDFEEALKKFNKGALGAEEELAPAAATQPTYIKDDFFDLLSCDGSLRGPRGDAAPAGDREDWRSKMAAQRKVDMETFGGMARSANSYRGRGRGRGRGYYGGRGGGGGGRRGGGGGQQQAQQ